ncbi:ribonuclease HI family protein [Deferribacter thermophilus]|uniref:ribonuclease HI family protein n=1 Tax=Deferribacter thermophilus TaxID=53573 RepID=UPI003C18C2D7
MKKKTIKIYTDGASSGNPGPSGIGFVIYNENGEKLKEYSEYIGLATNNIAEYSALIRALEFLKDKENLKINIFTDSELLVKQLKGLYKVKSKNLKYLYEKVISLLSLFEYELHHIPREENKIADNLAKKAVEYARKSVIDKSK